MAHIQKNTWKNKEEWVRQQAMEPTEFTILLFSR